MVAPIRLFSFVRQKSIKAWWVKSTDLNVYGIKLVKLHWAKLWTRRAWTLSGSPKIKIRSGSITPLSNKQKSEHSVGIMNCLSLMIGKDGTKFCFWRLRVLFIAARQDKDNWTAFSSVTSWRQVAIILLLTCTICCLAFFFIWCMIWYASIFPGLTSWLSSFFVNTSSSPAVTASMRHLCELYLAHLQCSVVFVVCFFVKSCPSIISVRLFRWVIPHVSWLIVFMLDV